MTDPHAHPAGASSDGEGFHHTQWPFYWVTQVAGRYLEQLEQGLKPIGIDVPRWRVLMSLSEGTASVSEIAERAIVKLPTMTKILQRMQADGLVECRPRATDNRVTDCTLTPQGRAARERAWAVAERVFHRAFDSMPPKDVAQLNRLLEGVFDRLGRR
jgi:DNA-binding MarR family transcriptional regulator